MSECDREVSGKLSPLPTMGCCAVKKKLLLNPDVQRDYIKSLSLNSQLSGLVNVVTGYCTFSLPFSPQFSK